MEKRFIIVECEELGDQWECDADRILDNKLYTLEEVQEKRGATIWYDCTDGEKFNTKEEAKACYEQFAQDFEEPVENFEDIFCEVPETLFECYEIDSVRGELIRRDDLSTYHND